MRMNTVFAMVVGLLFFTTISGCVDVSGQTIEAQITGTVQDTSGHPVGGIVSLSGQHVMTDEYGRFGFSEQLVGQQELAVFVGGLKIHEQSVDVSQQDIHVPVVVSMDAVTNLLANPNWDGAPEVPIGWQPFNKAERNKELFFRPIPDTEDGWIVLIDDPDDRALGLMSEKLPARPGVQYTASVQAYTDGDGGQATLYVEFFDQAGTRIGRKNTHYRGGSPNRMTVEEVAPDDTVSVYVRLISQGNVVGKSYFRDPTLIGPKSEVVAPHVPPEKPEAGTLLVNPRWEGAPGQLPDGWAGYNNFSVFGETLLLEPDPDDPGRRILVIDDQSDKNAYGFVSTPQPATSGTTYVASVEAKTDGSGGRATLYLEFLDSSGARVGVRNLHSTSPMWKRSEVQLEAPEESDSVRVFLYSSGGITGKSYFRDINLDVESEQESHEENELHNPVSIIEINERDNGQPTDREHAHLAQRVVSVNTTNQLIQAINRSIPGDMIVVQDGAYDGDTSIAVSSKRGTKEAPIMIVSETIGGVELTGSLQFTVTNSSYVVIEGFHFTTAVNPSRGRRVSGAVIIEDSDHIRVTRNHFALEEIYGESSLKDWVTVQGEKAAYNRIDHNLFENKVQNGAYLSINKMASNTVPTPIHTRVDHNHFRDMAPLGINGMEAVRIGVGPRIYTPFDAHTIFEYNLFERADGEKAEIISVKSSGNTIRYNTIVETAGAFTLRHGDRNQIYGNYFIGNGKSGARGVRVYGKDNRVFNNYFEGLTMAISLGNGGVNDVTELDIPSVTGYVRINRADIAFNTFVGNRNNIISTGRDVDTLTPLNTRIANNIFYSEAAGNHVIGFESLSTVLQLDGISWENNLAWGPGSAATGMDQFTKDEMKIADPGFVQNIDGIYYIGEESVARNAAGNDFTPIEWDIEKKQRGATPDIGAFEYSGYPLVRGPLTPEEVGPYAPQDFGDWLWDETPSVFVTDIRFAEPKQVDSSPRAGVAAVIADGVVTGNPDALLDDSIYVKAFVDGINIFEGKGFPAKFPVNTWQLDEGAHELTIVARYGDDQIEHTHMFTVNNVEIESPASGRQTVHGVWPVSLRSYLPDSLVERVSVDIDDVPIFTGHTVPSHLSFDSNAFQDGLYTLTVRIQRKDGGVTEKAVDFTIENFWVLADELLPPLAFFGSSVDRSETVESSPGWRYETASATSFFEDDSRLVRDRDTEGDLVWKTSRLTQAMITVYSQSEAVNHEDVEFSVSPDGTQYGDLPYEIKVTDRNDEGWHRLQLTVRVPDGLETGYFRLRLHHREEGRPEIQIGSVELTGRN